MADFPTTPEALTPAWLTEKLGFDVTAFEVELLGEGGEVLSEVTRLTSIDWAVETVAAAK